MPEEKLLRAIQAFDDYNRKDPNTETSNQKSFPKELLYATRMTERMERFAPNAPEHVLLATRCQHVGRWEIPRSRYPMNRTGYLQWRNELKRHHAGIAQEILQGCGYDEETIEKVKFLLLKRQLHTNPDTQLLEDVICLVFLEYYLEDFTDKHDEEKVVEILRKTLRKMSEKAIHEATSMAVKSEKIRSLLEKVTAS